MNTSMHELMGCKISKVSCEKNVNVVHKGEGKRRLRRKERRQDRKILGTVLKVKIG